MRNVPTELVQLAVEVPVDFEPLGATVPQSGLGHAGQAFLDYLARAARGMQEVGHRARASGSAP